MIFTQWYLLIFTLATPRSITSSTSQYIGPLTPLSPYPTLCTCIGRTVCIHINLKTVERDKMTGATVIVCNAIVNCQSYQKQCFRYPHFMWLKANQIDNAFQTCESISWNIQDDHVRTHCFFFHKIGEVRGGVQTQTMPERSSTLNQTFEALYWILMLTLRMILYFP